MIRCILSTLQLLLISERFEEHPGPPSSPSSRRLSISLDLMIQVLRQTCAAPPPRIHIHPCRSLHANNTVASVTIAGHNNASLPIIRSRRPTTGRMESTADRALPRALGLDVLDGLCCVSGDAAGHLGRTTIILLGVGGRRVAAVEARVFAEEFIIQRVCFIAGTAGELMRHCEGARHVGGRGSLIGAS